MINPMLAPSARDKYAKRIFSTDQSGFEFDKMAAALKSQEGGFVLLIKASLRKAGGSPSNLPRTGSLVDSEVIQPEGTAFSGQERGFRRTDSLKTTLANLEIYHQKEELIGTPVHMARAARMESDQHRFTQEQGSVAPGVAPIDPTVRRVILGGYCPEKVQECQNDNYFGNESAFLFSLIPQCNCFRSKLSIFNEKAKQSEASSVEYSRNFIYFRSEDEPTESKAPGGFAAAAAKETGAVPLGLGFGGANPRACRLWIDQRNMKLNSTIVPTGDDTYSPGNLIPLEAGMLFSLDCVEVYGFAEKDSSGTTEDKFNEGEGAEPIPGPKQPSESASQMTPRLGQND